MLSRKSLIAVFLVLVAVLLGSFSIIHDEGCCEKEDLEVQALMAAAERGEMEATRALYKRATTDGIEAMAEYWALTGALAGDRDMRAAYVQMFRTRMDSIQQKKALASIQEKSSMPGVPCLLEQLSGAATSVSAQCS
jgi:hypothetical protein